VPLLRLWSKVIRQSVLFEEAHGALTMWAALAESQPTQLDALVRLVRAVADYRDPESDRGADEAARTLMILSRVVAQWIAPENLTPLPRAHAAVTAELAQIRQGS
jgi:hypothetical protein